MDLSSLPVIPLIVLGVVIATIVKSSVIYVRKNQCAVIMRIGRYHSTAMQGLHLLVPFLDRATRVDYQRDIPHWRTLSERERIGAAQSLAILGTIEKDFRIDHEQISPGVLKSPLVREYMATSPDLAELAALTAWLTERATSQTGNNIAADELAVLRLTESAVRILKTRDSEQTWKIELPYLTANHTGPLHFSFTLDRPQLEQILRSARS